MLRRLLSRASLLVLCISGAACTRHPDARSKLTGDQYMLSQALGVELGMTWRQLRQARPNSLVDDAMIWEQVSASQNNSYLFGEEPEEVRRGNITGRLYAIVMNTAVPSDARSAYDSAVAGIRAKWESLAGPPTDTLHYFVEMPGTQRPLMKRLMVWSLPEKSLMLQYDDAPSSSSGATRLIRAVVYHPNVDVSLFLPKNVLRRLRSHTADTGS